MEQYKFVIESEEYSNRLQIQLFKLGFFWGAGGAQHIQHTGAPYLFANKDNTITYISSAAQAGAPYFKEHKAIESILAHPVQLKFLEKLIHGKTIINPTILFILANKFYFKRDREFLNGLLKKYKTIEPAGV